MTGYAEKTLANLSLLGEGPPVRKHRGHCIYVESEVLDWLKSLPVSGGGRAAWASPDLIGRSCKGTVKSPSAVRPNPHPSPPVKRAPQTTLVRSCDGEAVGRVPLDFADRIVSEGYGHHRRRGERAYVCLFPGFFIERTVRGWEMIEEARRLRGDDAVRREIKHLDNSPHRWAPPPPLPPLSSRR